jgi:DNA-binding transcriptional LysR family regulator
MEMHQLRYVLAVARTGSFPRAGLGISLIPEMAVRSGRGDLRECRSLPALKPTRKIAAVGLKQRPLGRAADEFLSMIAASLARPGR